MLQFMRIFTANLIFANFIFTIAYAQEQSAAPNYTAPIAAFSTLPEFTRTTLSPNGSKIAYIQNVLAPDGVAILSTYDTANKKVSYLLSSDNKSIKINWFEWANEAVLIVSVSYEAGKHSALYYKTRMFSIDISAQEPIHKRLLKKRDSIGSLANGYVSQFQDSVIDFLPDEPDFILVQVDFDIPQQPTVYKVNVYTGKRSRVEKGKLSIRHWYTDQQHQVRIGRARNYNTGKITYWHRFTSNDDFEELLSYTAFEDKPISVKGFGLDPNILYLTKYNGDKSALYKMNLSSKETSLVLAHERYDISGDLIYSTVNKEAIGIFDDHSPYGRYYFDGNDYSFHNALDNVLSDTNNFVHSFSKDQSIYILYKESDSIAGQYLLGNRKKNELNYLFSAYSGLDFIQLPEHESIIYTARDGLEIEALITLPKFGNAPYPTVIHPHGGPGSKDRDGFDPWVSYLSNKGYAVVRPNFRGSTGYGYEFSQAQMQSWGLAMQDDITDVTTHLIAQGIIDKSKVCIFGASYGGYAAMMATTKTPDLYSCAVSFAGVSDLRELARNKRRFFGGDLVVEKQFGDSSKDLISRSPISYVDNIKTPILLMHGTEDRSVSVNQSRKFVEELLAQNKVHKYVEFEYGDHYLSIAQNRSQFFAELDAFLTQHLGSAER
jgi:dipeptidyl aminopeptidase/acylaminoacyl peptidase